MIIAETLATLTDEGWIDIGTMHGIENGRAKTIHLPDAEPVAASLDNGQLSALTNV